MKAESARRDSRGRSISLRSRRTGRRPHRLPGVPRALSRRATEREHASPQAAGPVVNLSFVALPKTSPIVEFVLKQGSRLENLECGGQAAALDGNKAAARPPHSRSLQRAHTLEQLLGQAFEMLRDVRREDRVVQDAAEIVHQRAELLREVRPRT